MLRTLATLLLISCQASPPGPAPVEPSTPVLAAVGSILPAWRFLEVTGTVEIDGAPAARNMEIATTSTIVTAAGGNALITLGPGSIIEVRESSRLTLGASERKRTSVQLLAGKLWSLFVGPADFEVVTNNAVAGVRGTVFFVDAEQENETIVCACQGAVELESLDPRKPTEEEIVAETWEHIGFSFKRRGKRVRTKSIGTAPNPPSHPDARGNQLLALVPDE